jgi:putative spermidine/putrescine transport system permease protein
MTDGHMSLALRIYVTAFMIFLAVPIVIVIFVSFNAGSAILFPPRGFSISWYRVLIENEAILKAAYNSVKLASASTILALAIGIPAAMSIVRYQFPSRELIQSLLLSPMTLPMIVIGLALLFFFGKVGVGLSFLSLLVGHVVITLPYVVRTVGGVYYGIGVEIEEMAMVLGAGPWRTFWYITLPAIRPGIIAGGIFAFITSFDNIPISIFLTRTETNTLPVYIMSYLVYNFDPSVAAVSTLQLLFAMIVLWLVEKMYGLKNVSMMGGGG